LTRTREDVKKSDFANTIERRLAPLARHACTKKTVLQRRHHIGLGR
jgi:hypothetical protein